MPLVRNGMDEPYRLYLPSQQLATTKSVNIVNSLENTPPITYPYEKYCDRQDMFGDRGLIGTYLSNDRPSPRRPLNSMGKSSTMQFATENYHNSMNSIKDYADLLRVPSKLNSFQFPSHSLTNRTMGKSNTSNELLTSKFKFSSDSMRRPYISNISSRPSLITSDNSSSMKSSRTIGNLGLNYRNEGNFNELDNRNSFHQSTTTCSTLGNIISPSSSTTHMRNNRNLISFNNKLEPTYEKEEVYIRQPIKETNNKSLLNVSHHEIGKKTNILSPTNNGEMRKSIIESSTKFSDKSQDKSRECLLKQPSSMSTYNTSLNYLDRKLINVTPLSPSPSSINQLLTSSPSLNFHAANLSENSNSKIYFEEMPIKKLNINENASSTSHSFQLKDNNELTVKRVHYETKTSTHDDTPSKGNKLNSRDVNCSIGGSTFHSDHHPTTNTGSQYKGKTAEETLANLRGGNNVSSYRFSSIASTSPLAHASMLNEDEKNFHDNSTSSTDLKKSHFINQNSSHSHLNQNRHSFYDRSLTALPQTGFSSSDGYSKNGNDSFSVENAFQRTSVDTKFVNERKEMKRTSQILDATIREVESRINDRTEENMRRKLKESKSKKSDTSYSNVVTAAWLHSHDELLPATFLAPFITLANNFGDYDTDSDDFIHISQFREILKHLTTNSMRRSLENVDALTEFKCRRNVSNSNSNFQEPTDKSGTYQTLEEKYGTNKELSDREFDRTFNRSLQLLLKANKAHQTSYHAFHSGYYNSTNPRINEVNNNEINRHNLLAFTRRASELLDDRLATYATKFVRNGLMTLDAVIHILIHCKESRERATRFVLPLAKRLPENDCGGNVMRKVVSYDTLRDLYLFGIVETD
ncbi:hypothetical protein SNEBB_007928 [Seison nebaliae]|nr:hypothetical protein SNEBB_007928 [Seison nebaliae]